MSGGKQWGFDRYIGGRLMAQGITIENAQALEEAVALAARIAPRGGNGETPVLVLRTQPVEGDGDCDIVAKADKPYWHHDIASNTWIAETSVGTYEIEPDPDSGHTCWQIKFTSPDEILIDPSRYYDTAEAKDAVAQDHQYRKEHAA